jgi:hypothetical protein
MNRPLRSVAAAKVCTAKDERSQTVRSKVIDAPGKTKKVDKGSDGLYYCMGASGNVGCVMAANRDRVTGR